MPVSRTEKSSCARSPSTDLAFTVSDTSPCSVNLTALCNRLSRIWVRCAPSPCSSKGTSFSMLTFSCRPLPVACGCNIFCSLSTWSPRLKSASLRCSLPLSIAEMSSTSSTSSSRVCAEVWMTSEYSFCSGPSLVPRISSAMPMMPLSGERNSWLMLARKRVLAALARRASSVALCRLLSSDDR